MNKEEINKPTDIEPIDPKINVSINQYNLQGKFIKTFESLQEAATEAHITTSEITMCLNGTFKSCAGYQWRKKAIEGVQPVV